MKETKERNYYVDFLKFIFSVVIVFYHGWLFTGIVGGGYFGRGYYAVDFYFIVTGLLFIKSVEKLIKKKPKEEIGVLDAKFVWNKIKPLLPNIIFIFIIGYIIIYHNNILNVRNLFSDRNVTEFLLAGALGEGMWINKSCWYLSVMILVLFILFPIAYKYKKNYNYYIAPLLIIFTLGIINHFEINTLDPTVYQDILINGFYKGIIFINLGVIAYELCNYLKKKKITKKQKIAFTIIETILYIFLLANMHYAIAGSYLIAILFFIAIAITFSNISYTSNWFHSEKFQKLGKFGFILFLANIPARNLVAESFHLSYRRMLLIYWLITIFLSIISYVLSEVIIKKWQERRVEKRRKLKC